MNLPPQEIADVLQEVFHAVSANVHRFRRDRPGDTFRGWLRTITRNKVHDYFRIKQREPQAAGGTEANAWWSRVPDLSDGSEEADVDGEGDRLLFHKALEMIQGSFEKKTWQAFWRVVVDGCTPQEVADELAMTPGAVRVAKFRVLHRLRQELGDLQ
jgi:RNA polymerase sigma-70 factor (ECF subfamily)